MDQNLELLETDWDELAEELGEWLPASYFQTEIPELFLDAEQPPL